MKRFKSILGWTVIIVIVLIFWGFSGEDEKSKYGLFMLNLFGEWEHVVTVHGFYDNFGACKDVAQGLNLVSLKNDTTKRRYECRLVKREYWN